MAGYASTDDVSARLGRVLDPATEIPKVQALIDDVSALVDGFCRRTFVPVPGVVKAVVCLEVIRALNSTPGVSMEHVGDVLVRYAESPTALSDSAQKTLKRYRVRMASVPLLGSSWPEPADQWPTTIPPPP